MVGIYKNLKGTERHWHIFELRQFKKLSPPQISLNLVLLWQWLVAWKPLLRPGAHVSWRGLYVLSRVCYFRYLKLVVVLPEHFICHATGKDLKWSPLNFSINLQMNFLKRNLILLNWRQFSRFLFSNRLLEALISFEYVVHSSNFVVLIRFHNTA